MAAAVNILGFTARRCSARIPALLIHYSPLIRRPFGSSSSVRNEASPSSQTSNANSAFKYKLTERERAVYESLSDTEKQQFEKALNVLLPKGKLQERELTLLYFLNKYGMDFWKIMKKKLLANPPENHSHSIKSISEIINF